MARNRASPFSPAQPRSRPPTHSSDAQPPTSPYASIAHTLMVAALNRRRPTRSKLRARRPPCPQEAFLSAQVEWCRQRCLAAHARRDAFTAYRHEREYPAGPPSPIDVDSLLRRRMRCLAPKYAFQVFDDIEHWRDTDTQRVRRTDACARCRNSTLPPPQPDQWCTVCTTRDMCFVSFAHGKVIIASDLEERWHFG